MRLITIFVNDQIDAQFLFLYGLFQFSTCFEQPSAHHQQSLLYQYDLWYMSCYVGDRVHITLPRGHLYTVTYTRGRIDTVDSPDDEHLVARNM